MTKSHRAKSNMTKQLRARLSWLKSDLKTEAKGFEKAKYYCKLLGKNFKTSTSYKAYSKGIADTNRQLKSLEKLILRRQKNGECYKIL